jgi:glycosyltransferase involved in cell wall biosynthesis
MKVIGLIMVYNCARMIEDIYDKIPKELFDELIVVDDESKDNTMEIISRFNIKVFTHPHTGYGGNLLFGLKKAFELGATHVIEIHGDGQYDMAAVPLALEKLKSGCDLILGNRYYKILQPLREGMDIIRYLGNIFISNVARFGLGISTRDSFSGFRGYSKRLVETLDFSYNSSGYFFSFEIIAQAKYCGFKICPVPVNCNYKEEHSSMKISRGIPAIIHTFYTVFLYQLARRNIKRGVFTSLKKL